MTTSPARRRLLDAAVDAFAEQGFGGTSTRDIAARAGLSPAAVYVHHASKEGLLFEISEEGHHEALACLAQASESSRDPAERLHHMVYAISLWHAENAKVGRVVQYELHALTDEHRAQILTLRRQFQALMVDALTDGVRTAGFRVDDIDGTARALLSLCVDLVRWFVPAPGRDPAGVSRLNADLALRIVGCRPTTPSTSPPVPDPPTGRAPNRLRK